MGSGRGWKHFFRARSVDEWASESVDLELLHHIEMRTDELIAEGLPEEEARQRACEAFGQMDRYRAECVALQRREERMTWWTEWTNGWLRDVWLGLRSLRRSPGFALTLLLTLGLGVGANTAIFAVVDAVLVRPLPYADADRLVDVAVADAESGFSLAQMYKASALAWRDRADFLEEIGFWSSEDVAWVREGETSRIFAVSLTPSLVGMLGVEPILGRSIVAADGDPGAEKVVLLSEDLWSTDYGRDPGVIGSSMILSGEAHTVIGVMPRSFRFPIIATSRDVWVALGDDALGRMTSQRSTLAVVGRMASGADTALVRERARLLQESLVEEGVELSGFESANLSLLGDRRVNRDVQRGLWVVMGGSFIILLVAGMNAANLLLVRGSTRQAEIGVRLALGGSRARVVRQLAVEALLIAAAAALLAVLICAGTLEAILAMAPRAVSTWSPSPVELTGRVAAFTLLLSASVSLVFGVMPLVSSVSAAAHVGPNTRTTETRRLRRWRSGLVVAEVALSVVLMVGAGLFVKSFTNLIDSDPGFEVEGLVTVMPGLLPERYPENEGRRAFFESAREAFLALPGVESVALSSGTPPHSGITFGGALEAEGRGAPPDQPDAVPFAAVDDSFLETYRLGLVAGRNFGPEDSPDANVRIIDLEMARWLFGEDAPIGERYRMGEEDEWHTVIGVVRDLHLNGFDDAGQEYEVLSPLPDDAGDAYYSLSIRTSGDPAALFGPIRDVIRTLDPNQPVDRISIVADEMVSVLDSEHFLLRLMSIFAGLALGLSALGTFGVISFVVRRRFREIGIRVALGAARSDIRRMVMREGFLLALAGALIGIVVALQLGRFVDSLLTDVEPWDPVILLSTVIISLLVSAAATSVPARWATRVDPMEVLSAE